MAEVDPSFVQRTVRQRITAALPRIAACGLAALIAAGFAGQAIRDRWVAAALMMYIPLPLVGVAGLALDAARRGRSIPRFRFGLSLMGLAALAWSAYTMTGWGNSDVVQPGDREITVLHWNVLWGGGLFRGPRTWAAQRAAIVSRRPDLAIISEAPPSDWIDQLTNDLGPGASYVGIHHDARNPFWYHMVVCSRWPLRLDEHLRLPGGSAMSVVADVRGRRVRLLVVDGISSPMRSRIPFLQAIAEACRKADSAGDPYDLVAGDFNTPSRSLGFGALEDLGYRLAGRSTKGWRATFPSWLPVYDIDHVWLGAGVRIGSCTFFNGPYSDHRGQVVRVLLPEEHPE